RPPGPVDLVRPRNARRRAPHRHHRVPGAALALQGSDQDRRHDQGPHAGLRQEGDLEAGSRDRHDPAVGPQPARRGRPGGRHGADDRAPEVARPMPRYFEDLEIGDGFESPGRTLTEADLVSYAAISGDQDALDFTV